MTALHPLRFELSIHPERLARTIEAALEREPRWSDYTATELPGAPAGATQALTAAYQPLVDGVIHFGGNCDGGPWVLGRGALQRGIQTMSDCFPTELGTLLAIDHPDRTGELARIGDLFIRCCLFDMLGSTKRPQ